MNRADEVAPTSSLELPEATAPSDRELHMAEQLVASLTGPFEPERYPDLRRERVMELIERKAEGQAIEAPAPEEAPANVVSLAEALSASLEATRGRARGDASPARGERRHAPAQAARTARKAAPRRRSRKQG
jgi:DNA end-binding protein Ku